MKIIKEEAKAKGITLEGVEAKSKANLKPSTLNPKP